MIVPLRIRSVRTLCRLLAVSACLAACAAVAVEAATSQHAPSFVLFDKVVTHRGNRQLHLTWDFQERIPTHPTMPTNWLSPASPFFDRGLYQFHVEVRRMERAWSSPMHVQFGWWNMAKDPLIRHIASPPLLLTKLEPPAPGQPWVYEQVGTVRSLDRKNMYYGAGPKQGKLVFDWDWRQAFARNTAYTLINPRDNKLDADGDGKISETEYPDLEMRVVLTIHGPDSPLCKSRAADLPGSEGAFELQTVDTMVLGPWLKAVGDLNGDGHTDLAIGGAEGGGLVAYFNEYPEWRREVVDAARAFSTDGEVADVDGDGRKDIIAITHKPSAVVWYQNTAGGWVVHPIVANTWHDVEVADLDGDGRADLVGRNQKEWPAGKDAGNMLYVCWQRREGTNVVWEQAAMDCPPGEGLLLADTDSDGDLDIVINQRWYENLGTRRWTERVYATDAAWSHPSTFIAAGDINGDGRRDLILSPSELQGRRYKVSWFEAPADPRSGPWTEHLIVTNVETVLHFVGAADFNGDGRVDVVTAQMPQGADPDNLTLYLNGGTRHANRWSDAWTPKVLSADGSHSMRILDADGDDRPDLFGANWREHKRDERVKLWRNRL